MLKILLDHDVEANLELLNQAWADDRTFLFFAEKSGASDSWIQEKLAVLPAAHRVGHFILLTSGSTGQPKLVVGSKERAEKLARLLHDCQDGQPVAEALVALPLTYCYAFVNQWLWARLHSRRLVLTRGFGWPEELSKALGGARDAQLCLVRAQVSLLETYFPGVQFPGVIRLHFAGSRFPQERLPFLRQVFPEAHIYNNYGCTEAMPRLCLRRAEDADSAADVGAPLPGVVVKTDDAGELVFRSPYGAVAFIDETGFHAIGPTDWVGTGDLGRLDAAGHVQILGRASEVFKRHGEKVSISLLQQTVSTAWRGQSAFYREEDSQGEQGHVLIVSPHPSPEEVRAILQTIRQHHPRAQWPLRLESVEALPLLPNSKPDIGNLARLDCKKVHWYYRA